MTRSSAARLTATLTLVAASALCGCTSVSFAVANAPAHFTAVTRQSGLSYGDRPRQQLDLYLPPPAAAGASSAARPVIIFWYGGSWSSGARAEYRFVGTELAELGYVTVVPDYRLYPEVRFPAFLDDGARAVAWVQQHIADYGGDATRIVLMGHSAGAHMAAMLVADPQYFQRARVDAARIAAVIGLSGPYDLTPNSPMLHDIFGAPYTAHDWQVTARQTQRAPPMLLIHGLGDRVVLSRVSEQFAAQLRSLGGEVTLREYPHCDHVCPLAALSVPARKRAPALADVASFLEQLSARLPGSRPPS